VTRAPLVSVVMAVHNDAQYVRAAIASILLQSLHDFEFIIVDDGSTDRSAAILEGYAREDSRIRLLTNARNVGLTRSLNIGLDAVRGSFVARMDADDIALPGRLATQVGVFRRLPDIVLCGTNTIRIDAAGKRLAVGEWPEDRGILGWYALFRPAVAHPTAMYPASLVSEGVRYDERLRTAQDYELWSRLLQHGDATVVQEPLLLCRLHRQSITGARRAEQADTAAEICRANLLRRFPASFSRPGSAQATQIAAFLFSDTFTDEAAPIVAMLLALEEAYLRSLGTPAPRVHRAVRRLTVRWIVQALLTNRKLGLHGSLQAIQPLSGRFPALLSEGGRLVERQLKAKIPR